MGSILWGIAPLVVHELAHYLGGVLLGSPIHFRFEIARLRQLRIPRFVWDWPTDTSKQQIKFICQLGFLVELTIGLFAPLPYKIVAILHFALYPWYSGDHSDFYGMIN